ncbi:CaiB/BaiF CoA transferase family protein [Natrinema caseinilyticum]|uniref:CaiB/BaiF CoA transferase family protein n=1 Tax=Natrinema caseinilyticum TaxID=2961570 RepID=UPI0020C59216|nr:CoA transferase [Natrinema caseinilyticum]
MGFLNGIDVVDLTQMVSGPVATMHLGDMGADVVKIERPETGDISRGLPPFVDGTSSQFVALNRNKRSVEVDLRSDRGQDLVLELLEEADVFVENYKAGTVDEFGLDYDTVAARNPDLVYCSIKGFASDSIYEDNPAYDMVAQAMSGTMSINGQPDGPPTYTSTPISDIAASMYAVQAITGALYDRDVNDASGEYIEVSMLNCIMSWLGIRATASGVKDEPYPRVGNRHSAVAPYKVYETADSYVVVAVASQGLWPKFCRAIDREDLIADPRFETSADRSANMDALYDITDDIMRQKTTAEWFDILQEHGVPSGPVRNTIEALEDEYTGQQGLVQELSTDDCDDTVPVIRYPVDFGTFEAPVTDPRPLGADTYRSLRELGYDDAEIESLRELGVVG